MESGQEKLPNKVLEIIESRTKRGSLPSINNAFETLHDVLSNSWKIFNFRDLQGLTTEEILGRYEGLNKSTEKLIHSYKVVSNHILNNQYPETVSELEEDIERKKIIIGMHI